MSNAQKIKTKTLLEVSPRESWFFPKSVMARLCGVSEQTLDRYRDDLISLNIPQFEWTSYGSGYVRSSAECIYQYAQLIKTVRVKIAKQLIKEHLEEFFHDN